MQPGDSSNTRWQAITDSFEKLRSLPTEQQEHKLELFAAQDPELASEVRSLLAQDAQIEAEGFLPPPLPVSLPFQQVCTQLAEGTRLGVYRLGSVLGQGGSGTVYLAERVQDFQQQVAIKLLNAQLDARAVARFQREGQALAQLVHSNIVGLLNGGITETGLRYLVMEYVDGEPLDRYCEREQLTVVQRVGLVATAARAVSFAHEHHILHRDLTPANLLVTRNGTLKVADFGLAHVIRSSETACLTDPNLIMGTPSYMAPEQLGSGQGKNGPAVDCYGLGAILYRLLTHRPPFEASSRIETCLKVVRDEPTPLSQIDRQIPRDLVTIVEKAMARNPNERFRIMNDFSEQLRRFLANEPLSIRRPSLRDRLEKWLIRHKRGVLVWGTAFTCSLLTIVGLLITTNVRISRALKAEENQRQRAEASTKTLRKLFDQVSYSMEDLGEALQLNTPKVHEFLTKICEVNELALLEIPQREQDPALLHGTAIANYFLAMAIHYNKGVSQYTRTLDHFQRSIDLLSALVQEYPDRSQYRYNLSRSFSLRSTFYYGHGKYEQALADALASLDVAKALARDFPEESDYNDLVANKYIPLSDVYGALLKYDNAVNAANNTVCIAQQLVEEYPDKLFYKTNLYRAFNKLTEIYLRQERISLAEQYLWKTAKVNAELIRDMPSDDYHKIERVNIQQQFAEIRSRQGDVPGALDCLGQAVTLCEQAVKLRPHDGDILNRLLSLELKRAGMLLTNEQKIQAKDAFAQHLERLENLVSYQPERTDLRNMLVQLYTTCPVAALRNPDRAEQLRARK